MSPFISNNYQFCKASESASLLIITHEDFLDELIPLVEWKDGTGMPSILVSWQTLDAGFTGVDVPERIKRGIAEYEQRYGIEYVMLVGDSHMFPVRFQVSDQTMGGAGQTTAAVGSYMPCDLYYADLYDESGNFDTWDMNGNGYFGEFWGVWYGSVVGGTVPINQDHIDMIPDVGFGRVPASNEEEVTHYVNKVIQYERDLTWETENWVSNTLFIITSTEFPTQISAKEDTITNYSGVIFLRDKPAPNFIKMYSTAVESDDALVDYRPDADQINSLMEIPGIGLINFAGHGNTHLWSHAYEASDIPDLHTDNYAIAFICACHTGHYSAKPPQQPYTDVDGDDHDGTEQGEIFNLSQYPPIPDPLQPQIPPFTGWSEVESMAECTICRTEFDGRDIDSGCIAYIGCMVASQDPAGDLDKYFLEAYFTYDGDEKIIGDLWNHAIESYCDEFGYGRGETVKTGSGWFDVAKYQTPIKYHFFGDPSLRIGGLIQHPPILDRSHSIPDLNEGSIVDFSDYVTCYDPEGSTPEYRIDWNGDTIWDTAWRTTLSQRYGDDFEGTSRLQATDGTFNSETLEVDMTIINVDPDPSITTPSGDLEEDLDYTYTFNAGDPGDDDFAYYVDWDGDDVWDETRDSTDHVLSLKHSYESSGTYTIKLKVEDDDGGEGSASESVSVGPRGRMYDFWRRISELGGGSEFIGLAIFGAIITVPSLFSVLTWVKIPKWWRGCPMSTRVIVTLLPLIVMVGILVVLDIIPLFNMLGLK